MKYLFPLLILLSSCSTLKEWSSEIRSDVKSPFQTEHPDTDHIPYSYDQPSATRTKIYEHHSELCSGGIYIPASYIPGYYMGGGVYTTGMNVPGRYVSWGCVCK